MREFKFHIREKDNDDKSVMTFIIKKLLHRNNLVSVIYNNETIKIANEKNIHNVFSKIGFYGDNLKDFQEFDKLYGNDFYNYFVTDEKDYKIGMKRNIQFWKEIKLDEKDVRRQEYAFTIFSALDPKDIVRYKFRLKINNIEYIPSMLYIKNFVVPKKEDRNIFVGLMLTPLDKYDDSKEDPYIIMY